MGVLDMAKMARKAMQAKQQMSKINASGKAGSLSLLMDGLHDLPEDKIEKEELRVELNNRAEDKLLDKIISVFEPNIKNAYNNSRKSLEKELSGIAKMDNIQDLLKNAMETKQKMDKMRAAGKAGSLALLIDGLYTPIDAEIEKEELRLELDNMADDSMLDLIIEVMLKNIMNAFTNVNKDLIRELSNADNLDELKGLLN